MLAAAGKIEDRGKLYLTLNDSALTSAAQIQAVVIKSAGGGVVRLGDVASVRLTSAPAFARVTADGRPAVSLQVYQQPSGDTVRIVKAVAAVFAKAQATAPPGLHGRGLVRPERTDQSLGRATWPSRSPSARCWRAWCCWSSCATSASPWSPSWWCRWCWPSPPWCSSCSGQSFNIMTLGGMAAAIGLIIDDAIVMIEHMERRLAEAPGDRGSAPCAPPPQEFLRPLAGSSAATILIFLPLAFLSGVTGAFFTRPGPDHGRRPDRLVPDRLAGGADPGGAALRRRPRRATTRGRAALIARYRGALERATGAPGS